MIELIDLHVFNVFSFVTLTFVHTAKLSGTLLLIQIFLVFVILFRVNPILKISLIDHHLVFIWVVSLLSAVRESWLRVMTGGLLVEVTCLNLRALIPIKVLFFNFWLRLILVQSKAL